MSVIDLIPKCISNQSGYDCNMTLYCNTKMNLTSVCAVIDGNPCSLIDSCVGCETPASIDASPLAIEPFYQTNTIDPLGQLFGRAQCGINNFTRYMVYSPPTKHY